MECGRNKKRILQVHAFGVKYRLESTKQSIAKERREESKSKCHVAKCRDDGKISLLMINVLSLPNKTRNHQWLRGIALKDEIDGFILAAFEITNTHTESLVSPKCR